MLNVYNFNTVTPPVNPKPNQKKCKIQLILEQNSLFHTNKNNKYMCKIICKMQCYGLLLSVSEGSVSSINPICNDVFWPCNRWWWGRTKLPPPYFSWIQNCYLLNWNLAHIISNLRSFKKAKKKINSKS